MAKILLWDFAPGLNVEDQIRCRFGSLVHFNHDPKTKDIFLVVSFSSTSFPLSVESVGLVLQCCIGGLASGFKVESIGARNFWFSVASHKVGHFIYALRDRVWPDFTCHFGLFKHPFFVIGP